MAKWIAIRKQKGEGCDYMIGCGKQWHVIDAPNADAALAEALRVADADDVWDDGCPRGLADLLEGEREHERFEIYPVVGGVGIDVLACARRALTAWEAAKLVEENAREEEETERRERAELARLKEKYG